MKRGDLVTAVVSGDYGKPRPALIIQSDQFETPSVTILLVTSTLLPAHLARVDVHPTHQNGLTRPSQIMVDRIMTVPRERVGSVIGKLDAGTIDTVERQLMTFLGLLQ